MPTIKFKSNEDRIKGIGILFRSKYGFHGFSNGQFIVKEEQIEELSTNGVKFSVVP